MAMLLQLAVVVGGVSGLASSSVESAAGGISVELKIEDEEIGNRNRLVNLAGRNKKSAIEIDFDLAGRNRQ